MGRAEAGSTKAIANAVKAKGLGRLRWYCQVCEKQCRDENGFKSHITSEPHLRKMMTIGPKAGQTIANYSNMFQSEFVTLLRTRHQTNRVQANKVYNEYIQDKHHVHMNSTRWVTLNGFIKHLGTEGIVRVEEDDKGVWITWVDDRPETLARQKRDRAQMDGEERERKMLADQIARAKAAEEENSTESTGLQKSEGEKITLTFVPIKPNEKSSSPMTNNQAEAGPSTLTSTSLSTTDTTDTTQSPLDTKVEESKPAVSAVSIGSGIGIGIGGFGALPAKSMPVKGVNPLKRPATGNVFKSASSKTAKTEKDETDRGDKKMYMSEAERLMKEDQARKASRQGQGYGGYGPKRVGER